MRALVTGASGFIGSYVMEALLDRGVQVRAMARNGPAADYLRQWPVEIVYGDLTTGLGLEDACQGVHVIFHVAAFYSLERRYQHLMYETNIGGTQRLLAAMRRASSVERMIYTSSTATVGLRPDHQPADESLEVDPNTLPHGYKRSKVLAEQVVRQAVKDGMNVVIVNPSTPIGARDVKPTPTGALIRDAVLGRMPAYVETGLNWVAVRDVAQGHLLAWEKGQCGERYILGHENLTLRQLFERIERLGAIKAPRLKIPLGIAMGVAYVDELVWSRIQRKPPKAPIAGVELAKRQMFYSATRAVLELGLPQTPLDQALAEAIQWFRACEANHRPHAARPLVP
ncbi:MAG: dihydroflavonol 4-reductase [Sulfobacillus acidophilus]|uniref:Dihydroflavonol 4-reductase n=1 Tax=Sulfobacillus acidophilus TaxID=53633 RepID=A0A2T2WH12_9FIRM|nr:MAG: dihydroflavonol 4-reductase [Sulfobacillus acidophilus]